MITKDSLIKFEDDIVKAYKKAMNRTYGKSVMVVQFIDYLKTK